MRNSCRITIFFAVSFAVLHPASPAAALQGSLELAGQVVDAQGGVIPGASISLQSGGSVLTKISNRRGEFSFQDLAAGQYFIRVEVSGFEAFEKSESLQGSILDYTVQLQVSPLSQTVTVTSTMPEFVQEQAVEGQRMEEAATSDTAQFLRGEPGLSSFRRGPINLEPTIRGLQETEVGMFVNGTRTFAAGPARMDSDISHVSPHIIQSVRAVKGPYALSWGAGTLSALQIETFKAPFIDGDFETHARAGYRYGENAVAHDAFVNFWGSNDRFRFHFFYNRRQGRDYRAGDDQLIPGDYESDDFHWSLGFRINPETVLEYTGGYQEQNDIDYPGRLLDATYFFTRSHSWKLTWRPASGPVAELHGQFYINRKDHLMNNDQKPTASPAPGRIPPFGIRVDLPTESNTLGGNYYALFRKEAWKFKAGFDFYNSDQTAQRAISRRSNNFVLFRDIVWPEAEINDQGVYGQVFYEGERGQVGAGVRADFVQASAGEVSAFFRDNTTGSLDQDETNVSASLGGEYRLTGSWTLSAGLGRAVRTANVLERYSDRFPSTKFQLAAEFMGNPELDPEASLEFNLGTSLQLGPVFLKGEAFHRQIDDYITVQADPTLPRRLPLSPPLVFRYINGSEARFYGAELQGNSDVGPYANLRGSLSYVWAEDELFQEPVLGIQPLTAQLGLELHTVNRRMWLDFNATFVDRQNRVAAARFERRTPGYAVFDLRSAIQLPANWIFKAGLENIGDRAYSYHLNSLNPFTGQRIPEIGRNFFVGLEFHY